MKHVLSIGLNVGNDEPAAQLDKSLRVVSAAFGPLLAVAMGRSEWDGVPERFVQIVAEGSERDLAELAPRISRTLDQSAIAYVAPDGAQWTLAYGMPGRAIEPGGTVAEFPIIVDVEA
jgi:hypothetical protein